MNKTIWGSLLIAMTLIIGLGIVALGIYVMMYWGGFVLFNSLVAACGNGWGIFTFVIIWISVFAEITLAWVVGVFLITLALIAGFILGLLEQS